MPNLLLEIGTEEIPAGYLEPALEALAAEFSKQLGANDLSAQELLTTGTPRRLVLFAAGLPEKQDDRQEEVIGPPKRVAFDGDGIPTRAGEGFARKQGVQIQDIRFRQTPRGEYCFVIKQIIGKKTIVILAELLPQLVASLPFPKSMHWLDPNIKFARPIRSILALYGDEVVPMEFNGVKAGRASAGHTFLAPGTVELQDADFETYKSLLKERKVIVDIAERRAMIEAQLNRLFAAHGSVHGQPALLDEVTNLVEFPCVLEGTFDERFLEVPREVVETAMMEHQRYFPVHDSAGRLLNRFVFVANRDAQHADVIREGNERVLRARLSDARFFWDEDRKKRLEDRVPALKSILYQEKLGSYYERTERLRSMARFIANECGLTQDQAQALDRAALLCKADLLTEMVYEFPSLQGIMGRAYALNDGELPEVAQAIEEHYLPRQARGPLPQSHLGAILALADKSDTIVACFAAGLAPTANQDPYALRRQAIGIIRIIVEKQLALSLNAIFSFGMSLLPKQLQESHDTVNHVLLFMRDRIYNYCLDRGYRYDLVLATLDTGFDDLLDFQVRLDATTELSRDPDWERLYEVVERTHNIVRNCIPGGEICEQLLIEAPERRVYDLLKSHAPKVEALFSEKRYVQGAKLYLDTFGDPVHDFFDKVFVNVEDSAIRNNRLLLMYRIYCLFADGLANLVHRQESAH